MPGLPHQPTARRRGARPTWASFSLRIKLMVAFLLVAALAIGLVAGANFWGARQELSASAQRQLKREAAAHARIIHDVLSQQIAALESLALNTLLQDAAARSAERQTGSPQAIAAAIEQLDARWLAAADDDPLVQSRLRSDEASELREFQASFSNHAELFVTDRYGALVAASSRTSDFMQADEEWWRAAWDDGRGSIYIGQPTYDESSKIVSMQLAVPIYGRGSRATVGVLRASYAFNAIAAAMSAHDEENEADLLFPNGYVLHPEGDYLPIEPAFERELRAAIGLSGAEMTYEEQRMLVSLAPIGSGKDADPALGSLGWYVISYEPASLAFAPVVAASRATLLTALLVLGLASLVALGLARLLSQPLEYLTRTVRLIAGGDLSRRLELARSDEIGMLAQSVDAMTAALVERIAEAQRLQQAEQASRAELELAARERIELQDRMIAAQGAALAELTAPLIPISDTLSVMPLIGAIDAERAGRIQDALLRGVAQGGTTTVILDITGVPVVDTAVAQALIQAAQALRLLGVRVILTGTRPDVAQTLVALGIDLGLLVPQATLQSGITYALARR